MEAATGGGDRIVGLDAVTALSAQSPDGICGEELFFEHVHFTPDGNYRIARLLADEVAGLLPSQIAASDTGNWLDGASSHRRLALTSFDQKRLWADILQRSLQPPFKDQSSHPRNLAYTQSRIREIDRQYSIETPWRDRNMYETALKRSPTDTFIIGNYAQFLEATGSRQEAISLAQRYCELVPDMAWPHYYLGALLELEGREEEAIACFEKALEMHPESRQAREALKAINKRSR